MERLSTSIQNIYPLPISYNRTFSPTLCKDILIQRSDCYATISFFGSAKDVLRGLQQQTDLTRSPYLSGKDSAAHLYPGAQVQHIFINDRNELEATVSFSIPPQLRKRTSKEQSKWWEDSSRLDEGSLICFLTSQGTHRKLIFLEVTVKNASKNQAHQNKSSLVSDRHSPSITVKLAACLQHELMFLGQLYSERLTGILVEFHGLIPATFVPILENLQQIQREGDLAFRKWVLPDYKDTISPHRHMRVNQGLSFP